MAESTALTDERHKPPSWYPCENPERPNDGLIVWHTDCRGCWVAAKATQARRPECGEAIARILQSIIDRAKPRDIEPLSVMFR